MKRPRVPARIAALAALALSAACTSGGAGPGTGPVPRGDDAPPRYVPLTQGLPEIPRVEAAAPAIRVVHPVAGSERPRVDSTFIYGSVGTGDAALFIEGVPVPVAPNGAFLAYLPVPEDGAWNLEARKGGQTVTGTVAYQPEPDFTGVGGGRPAPAFTGPRRAIVQRGADTLATGSDAIYARPTPTGTYRWFFPRGTWLTLVERRGGQYRVWLDSATIAWVDTSAVRLVDGATVPPATFPAWVTQGRGVTDLRVQDPFAPFLVETEGSTVTVTVYGATGSTLNAAPGGALAEARQEEAGGSTKYVLRMAREPWGYKAFYDADGTLVVRVRQAPAIDPANPLRGMRIVIDPGHPPAGATGPTGLREAEANLAIAIPLATKLRQRGAEVILTRTGGETVELGARTTLAVRRDAHLLVSVHNNAFGEGQNPFRSHGTSTYYFHPASAALARALDREIVAVTRLPDLGARQGNLALVRPTWMPSVLTESVFMPIPEQESALRDAGFVERLADAHVRGIEAFLRERAGR